MDENMELSDLCRLCLTRKDKSLQIFAENDPGEDTLISKIRACVGVEVLQGDDLPKQICFQCSCHINLWYYFKQDCAKSQRKLKSWHCHAAKTNESSSEIDEVIHIKQEPPDYPCESFRERNVDGSAISTSHNTSSRPSIADGLDSQNADDIEENDGEDMETSENPMNLIIMDTTSIPTDNLSCQGEMGSTVIELQPEDEDLLRTVVESEEELRNPGEEDDDSEVTVLQVGREDSGAEMMEEITLDEDSTHSSVVEEASEEDLESPPFESSKTMTGVSVQLVRVKEEKDDWTWSPNDTSSRPPSSSEKQVSTPVVNAEAPATGATQLQQQSWQCPKCPRTFSSSKTKNIHLAKSHKDKPENGTVQSVESSSSPARALLPKIINSLYDEELMLCKICDRTYPSHYYLWRHLRRSHEDQKPFACQVCRRIFKTKRDLTSHRLRTISKHCRLGRTAPPADASKMYILNPEIPNNVVGRYTCKECRAPFKCFSLVKKHFTIHTGELPYQCPKCKREFREYKTASLHYKACNAPLPVYKYSPSEQPKTQATATSFKCPKCPKVFSYYTSLYKHKKRGCVLTHFCTTCSKNIDASESKTHAATCVASNEINVYPRKRVERTSLTLQDILDIHKEVDGQDPQELKCKVCNSFFGSLKSLKTHIRKHSALPDPPTSLRCDICNLSVQHESTLRSHMESYHGEGASTAVPAGPAVSAVPAVKPANALVAKHKARLAGYTSSKLKCDQCHKLFSSMSALQFHKRTHKPRDISTLTCPVCKKVFMTPNALGNHKKIHASIQLKMKIYKCTFCANSYSDAKDLQAHKMSAHREEESGVATNPVPSSATPSAIAPENDIKQDLDSIPPKALHKCDTCGKRFTAESSLVRHKKLHEASQDINKFRCETCNKSFVSSKSFDSHKGWHSRSSTSLPPILPKIGLHPKVRSQKFYCPVCGKIFLHKANAKRHMIMQNHNYRGPPLTSPVSNPVVQADTTEYRCKQCPQYFTYLKAYRKHLQEHKNESGSGSSTGDLPEEGPLVCKLCKKTLRSVKGYKKHLLGHSNQKPFKCDVCSNQYSSETALTKHKQAHEFKAFACNKCKACFSEKDELIAHYESCNV